MVMLKRGPLFACLLAITILTGCASAREDESANDPLEGLNRQIFTFNKSVDTFAVRPLAVTYRDLVPDKGKEMVDNFLSFIHTPVMLINDLLQGDWEHADQTAQRFMQNLVTLGLGDPAAAGGIPRHDADFGLTLARWGAGDGFYLVIPVLGPSNVRDGVGYGVDALLDPITWVSRTDDRAWIGWTDFGMRYITYRSASLKDLDQIEAQSLDFYATMRSLYKQYRDGQIRTMMGGKQGSSGPNYRDLMSPAMLNDPNATTTSSVAP